MPAEDFLQPTFAFEQGKIAQILAVQEEEIKRQEDAFTAAEGFMFARITGFRRITKPKSLRGCPDLYQFGKF